MFFTITNPLNFFLHTEKSRFISRIEWSKQKQMTQFDLENIILPVLTSQVFSVYCVLLRCASSSYDI